MTREDCNDVVSRKAVINLILEDAVRTGTGHRYTSIQNMNNEINEVRALPPATPTRKRGKWINKSHTSDCGIRFVASECTCCGKKTFFDCDQLVYNYCPNCGAYMREVEE